MAVQAVSEPKAKRLGLVGDTGITIVIIMIGLMIMLAALVFQARGLLDARAFDNPDDYYNAVRGLNFAGGVLINIAMFLLLVFALLVGLQRTDLSDSTRKAFMAFALVIFFIWWAIVVAQSQSVPYSYFP